MPWTKLTVFLYTWVQVQNKTLWTAPLWTYRAVWTTASCKQSELNCFCERTQIYLRERKTFEKYFFLPPRIFPTTMSLKGLRTYNIKSVTFDQFHVSLLNKSIPFFQKERKSYSHQIFEWYHIAIWTKLSPSVKSNRSVLLTTGLCRQDFG